MSHKRSTFRPQLEALEDRRLLSVGASFRVGSGTDYFGGAATTACASSPSGRSVAVWVRGVFGNTDVFARVYDSAGNAVTGEIRVASSADPEDRPAVAMDNGGNFVVAWDRTRDQGANQDVYAQQFLADGTLKGGLIKVAATTRKEYEPSVAVDTYNQGTGGKGEFVVSYTLLASVNNEDVHARMFSVAGERLRTIVVSADTATDETSSRVARNGSGSFDIVYQQTANIFLKRYDRQGNFRYTQTIAASERMEIYPSIAMDNAGNSVVAWHEFNSTTGADIRARKVLADGTRTEKWFIANSTASELYSSVALDQDSGRFVVGYRSNATDSTTLHAQVAEVSTEGTVLGTFDLGANTTRPAVSMRGADKYFIAYEGYIDARDEAFARYGMIGA